MDNFKLEKNGYNKKEVDDFVEKVKRDYEDTMQDQMQRISELKKQLDETNKKLDSYQKKSGDISDALVVAVETAKQIENSSKDVYELEIKRIRALYSKWEKFLDELMNEYPKLKERFDTKALLKIFNDGIDDVIKQNAVDLQPQTQSVGLRSLISKMNKINDKTVDNEADELKKSVIKPKSNSYSLYDNLTSIGTVAKQQEEFEREYELFVEEQEELEKQRKQKLEEERKLAEKKRQEELLLIKEEQQRQAKLEQERRLQEQAEREKQEELLKQQKLEEERLEELKRQEKLEQERIEKEKELKLEQEQKLKQEQERLEKERKELERQKQELLKAQKEEQDRIKKQEQEEKERQEKLKQAEKEKELANQKFEKSYFDDAPQLIDEDIFLKMEQDFAENNAEQTTVHQIKRKDTETNKEDEVKKSQIKSISNMKIDYGDKFENLVDKFLSADEDDENSNSYEKAVLSKKKKENSFDLSEALTPDDDLSTIMESFDAFNTELENNKDDKNK